MEKETENGFDPKEAEKEYEKFISNPENRKRATILANQIREAVGKNWFTFDRFCEKLKFKTDDVKSDAYHQLAILQSFGLCASKKAGYDVPKNKRGKIVYKIIMDYYGQIDLIDHDIAYHEARVEVLKGEREKLVERQKKLEHYEISNPDKVSQGENIS